MERRHRFVKVTTLEERLADDARQLRAKPFRADMVMLGCEAAGGTQFPAKYRTGGRYA